MSEFKVGDIIMPLEGLHGETAYTLRAFWQPAQITKAGPIKIEIHASEPRGPFGAFSTLPTALLSSYARLATKDECVAYLKKLIANEMEVRVRSDGRLMRWTQAIQELKNE
jgi:hypothetical protein